ncbi:hypothetical protein J421_5726 (plasmid) [Gemmatirosa kalamazoonensis]|uniref:Outer membrane protein beta-barrel domain-containing protein n=1 Tax=Gemmatirosa kalamazoonensis TaxID=861299 RepID=W0RRF3_9BACT|nr:outer membrane beta-barrel protein [Gemmatirosa kalamazoonensis]AHG93261.1 hypothetical protein J421_5726 [Gemmatirosa kalamazoonensis]
MRRLNRIAAAVPMMLISTVALAQPGTLPRWSAEVSGDAAFPTRTLAGADLQTGGGFGANVRVRLQPHLAAYAGWEWHMQQTKQLLPGETLDLNDNGYTFGLRFEHPIVGTTKGWLRAGGLYDHIEVENADGKTIHDSGHGLGWEGGAGFTLPLGTRFALTPGVRYRELSRDITVGGRTRSSTLSYVTTGVGVAFSF